MEVDDLKKVDSSKLRKMSSILWIFRKCPRFFHLKNAGKFGPQIFKIEDIWTWRREQLAAFLRPWSISLFVCKLIKKTTRLSFASMRCFYWIWIGYISIWTLVTNSFPINWDISPICLYADRVIHYSTQRAMKEYRKRVFLIAFR